MRRFLLPLIASLSLPIAANAESAWLIIRYGRSDGSGVAASLEKIEMKDMNQCKIMGAKWMGTKTSKGEKARSTIFGFECLEGK